MKGNKHAGFSPCGTLRWRSHEVPQRLKAVRSHCRLNAGLKALLHP